MGLDSPQAERAHAAEPATGVLLINLGTPDAPTAPAIRRYLKDFLSDRRVVDVPRAIWLPVLYGFILTFRPRRLAHAYASIWRDDGAPLLAISRQLAAAMQPRLAGMLPGPVKVAVGMRYGQPSIAAALDELAAANVRRLLVLPLFPQYSASTNASAFDAVWQWMQQQRWLPEIHTLPSYHDDPGYIAALAASVRAWWDAKGRGEHLLMSFHGVPRRYVLLGDPYYCHCRKTGRLLADALGLAESDYSIAFQSRFGREPWLQPYTDELLTGLSRRGLRRVDAICPGFSADCLETLEEVAIRYHQAFKALGGELRYIPALNDGAAHADALAQLAAAALQPAVGQMAGRAAATPAERVERARQAAASFYGAGAGD